MFLQLISILILIVLVVIVLDLQKIKKSVADLQGQVDDINTFSEPKKCIWEYTTESWWELELPNVILPAKVLKTKSGKPVSGDIKHNKEVIEKVLKAFNIGVEKMNDPHVGPVTTQYTFKPAINVKLQDIFDLQNNFSMELASNSIRIDAPIPGTDLVGIEVPNQIKAFVGLREELETNEYKNTKGDLVIPFGRDVRYEQWNIDLHELPHLLIGGATDSGKSAFINSLIISLMAKHSPNTLRFILVDFKRVELPVYNNIPHLLTPVITDVNKAINALKWCTDEMDRRFDVLSKQGKRNIAEYNETSESKMPYIIFVIDELADAMVVAGHDIELSIIRLAQMARAVGIHLILATQRPSEEILTGMLKANIPGRLAFSVASSSDSEAILDYTGAEMLFGRGDALFINAEMVKPIRLQVPYVSDEDIQSVVEFIKTESVKYQPIDAVASAYPEDNPDELLEEAKKLVIESRRASASFIQRKLQIGYARSAYLLDQLENLGIVGPANGDRPREVLVKQDHI